MSTVKLALGSMATAEKVQFARRLADVMDTYHWKFPNMPVGFDDLTDHANAAESSLNAAAVARDNARMLTSQLSDYETALDQMLAAVAGYVDVSTDGDAYWLQLMGFETRRAASPIGPLPAPEKVTAEKGIGPGAVALRWRPVRGAMTYAVECRDVDGNGDWRPAQFSTKAKLSLGGLRSGTRYESRVAAIGAAGQSAWSDPVPLFAP